MAEKEHSHEPDQLIALSLVETEVLFNVGALHDEGGFAFEVEINTPAPVEDGISAFDTQISVFKFRSENNEQVAGFSAKYWCGMELTSANADPLETAKHFAATTVWGTFSGLFAVVRSQMGVSFPPLPPFPGRVKVTKGSTSAEENGATDSE